MSDPNPEKEQRIKDFLKDYGELVTKHKIDFATYPVLTPNEKGQFSIEVRTTPVDITNQEKKTAFVATDVPT